MKLTWFAASCFRLHVGGAIIVTDPEAAPEGVDPFELTSGADTVVTLGVDGLPDFSADGFAPRRATSFIDSDAEPPLALHRFGESGLFVDPPGDSPVILCGSSAEWGRFADSAVVVLFGAGADLPARLDALTRAARPRLVAIATGDFSRQLFAEFAKAGQGTPLQIMEPGLALEA